MAALHKMDATTTLLVRRAPHAIETSHTAARPFDEDDFIDAIYSGTVGTEPWSRLLEMLRERLRAIDITLILRAPNDDCDTLINTDAVTRLGTEAYRSRFLGNDPFVDLPSDRVITPEEKIGSSRWKHSELYREFLRPLQVTKFLGADLGDAGGLRCRFRVSRTSRAPDFTDTDRALCERLLPHLSRALRLRQRCNDVTAQRQIYANAVSRMGYGTIRVSATGEVLGTNAEARRIFEQKDGISITNGHLHVHHAQESRELHRCIRNITVGLPNGMPSRAANAVLISRPSGRLSIGVVVRGASGEGLGEPLAPHLCSSSAVLMLRDPETDMGSAPTAQAIVKKLFNLSPKESTLALALADGLSIEEAAEHCSISRNTARTYMRAVYLKTGVKRQTDLVRLLINNVVTLAGNSSPAPMAAPLSGQPQ